MAPFAEGGIRFNLSHSEGVGLVALTRQTEIGVDVERVRALPEADELVKRFFSRREGIAYAQLPSDQKPAAFFNLWTRKEAWLKATGEGIAHSLHLVEVSFLPDEPARLLYLPAHLGAQAGWSLQALSPLAGYAAAVAVKAQSPRVSCWRASIDE